VDMSANAGTLQAYHSGVKVLAVLLLVAGFAAVITIRSMAFQNWGGLWWLAGGGIAAVCVVAGPLLWRAGERRSVRRPGE
jgi:hypothetical protein